VGILLGSGWQLLVGEAFDLDAHDAERGIWCASHVEIRPGINPHFAVGGVAQSLCVLHVAVGIDIGQPKGLTMQARPAAMSARSFLSGPPTPCIVSPLCGSRPRRSWKTSSTCMASSGGSAERSSSSQRFVTARSVKLAEALEP